MQVSPVEADVFAELRSANPRHPGLPRNAVHVFACHRTLTIGGEIYRHMFVAVGRPRGGREMHQDAGLVESGSVENGFKESRFVQKL